MTSSRYASSLTVQEVHGRRLVVISASSLSPLFLNPFSKQSSVVEKCVRTTESRKLDVERKVTKTRRYLRKSEGNVRLCVEYALYEVLYDPSFFSFSFYTTILFFFFSFSSFLLFFFLFFRAQRMIDLNTKTKRSGRMSATD